MMRIIDKIKNLIRNRVAGKAIGFLSLLVLASCSMINEDLQPCAPAPDNYTLVDFTYTYNMSQFVNDTGEEEDWFDDHVGTVHLYIFDEDGTYEFDRAMTKADMTSDGIDFTMRFSDKELIPGKTYQFVAMAQGNHGGYEASLETPGFQIPLGKELIPGVSSIYDYEIKLDRDDDHEYDFGIINYKDEYGNNQAMIDTLWSTKPGEIQKATIKKVDYVPTAKKQPDVVTRVKVPMMRITNSVTVDLLHPQFSESTDPDNYLTLIDFPHGNGRIDFLGNLINDEETEELIYRSLRKNMINYTEKKANTTKSAPGTRADGDSYAIEAQFGVSRMMMNDQSSLQIRDAATNDMVAEITNFSRFIANAFGDEYGIPGQEFLDREYEFEITLALKDDEPNDDPEDNWSYIELYVKVLNWYVRINNVGF